MELPPGVVEITAQIPVAAPEAHLQQVSCEVVHLDSGTQHSIPCFWAGGNSWGARIRTDRPGRYRCTIGDQVQEIAADPVSDSTWAPELQRTPESSYLQTRAGEPFFWLADTWWYGLCGRIGFPGEFNEFLQRRRDQGYSVVQIVAGLYPEVYAFDRLGETDGRWPWTRDFAALDPQWWEQADARILEIARNGVVPAIVGAWSYYLQDMGDELIAAHWRQIVARWAALPVVWCVAGEGGLPHYDQLGGADVAGTVEDLRLRWQAIAAQVREWDPYQRVMTVHPCPAFEHFASTDVFDDRSLLDLVWLQTGHSDQSSVPPSLDALDREIAVTPRLPVLNSEVCYEGIAGGSAAPLQRFLFWSHVLSGAAGHTYGAQGIWAFRNAEDPGPGGAWGEASWREAAQLPGAVQVGAGARVLRDVPWERLRPDQDAVTPHASAEDRFAPYAASGESVRVVYVPPLSMRPLGTPAANYRDLQVHGFGDAGATWEVRIVSPRTGLEVERHTVPAGTDTWTVPRHERSTALPTMEDWVLICERL